MYRTIPIVAIDPRGGSIQLDAATLHMAQSQEFKDAVCHCTN